MTNIYFFAFSFALIEKEKIHNSVSMTFQKRKINIERVLHWTEERKMSSMLLLAQTLC